MKTRPGLAIRILPFIGLAALALVLASLKTLGWPTAPPGATETSVLTSVMPEMLLPKNNLVCPMIPSTAVLLPPAPYDEELGDCALIGRSEEIEAWLTELEGIAANCHANRETNWARVLAARDNLDSQIDGLVRELAEPSAESSDERLMQALPPLPPPCPTYTGDHEPLEPSRPMTSPTHYYTDWLKRIGENVEKYCTKIDGLVKPLWRACDEINFYQDCQAPNPEQYHSIVEWKMNAAQLVYNYTDFFYTNTLQTYGWGNFRMYFNEASIDCPPVQPFEPIPLPASIPTFTFSKNAMCREGPSTKYEAVTAFLQGQSVQIDGRNQDGVRWWWVLIPDSGSHCWVSDSTGLASGPLEGVLVVSAPPLPPSPTPTPYPCYQFTDQNSCEAHKSQCVWIPGQTGAGAGKCRNR